MVPLRNHLLNFFLLMQAMAIVYLYKRVKMFFFPITMLRYKSTIFLMKNSFQVSGPIWVLAFGFE